MNPVFFRSASKFRRWLEKHHDRATELWVGFYKKASGKRGITYAEALDQALCFGWIDGIKKRVDEDGYTHRFSPRRAKSVWSATNTKRVGELKRLGLMKPSGLAVFAKRDPARSSLDSFESPSASIPAPMLRTLKANKKAWSFFAAQPPGYRRVAVFWVISAKQEETRLRRLGLLIRASEQGVRFGMIIGTNRT